jgi:hypothetical protein
MRTLGQGSAMRSAALGETGKRLARRNRALDVRFAGVPLRDHEERRAADLMSDLAEGLYEALSFAHLAVAAGIDGSIEDIEKREPPQPDLFVRLRDGSSVNVEVGRVRAQASGRHSGEIEALNKGLMLAARADPDLVHHVQGHHISFGMATVSSKPERPSVIAEVVATLRALTFAGLPRVARFPADPALAPTLSKLGVRISVAKSSHTYVTVSSRAGLAAPATSVLDFEKCFRAKLAGRYHAEAPLWLAMPLEDDQQLPSSSLAAIRAALPADIGQFARLIVGTLDGVAVIAGPG